MSNLLIFYDYFYPGYKAGGPIQSLTNLAIALQNRFSISIITSAYDLQTTRPYANVVINAWNDVTLPGNTKKINVFYAGNKTLTSLKIQQLINEAAPQVIYLNGMFSFTYFLLPLYAVKKIKSKCKVVVCPRGMLQKGALSGKLKKKKLYLAWLKVSGLLKKAYWHATNHEELLDIKLQFRTAKNVVIASNIPKPPYTKIALISKQPGQLKLVYLSLIAEKKNLYLLLQVLKDCDTQIVLHIYGPVKDQPYWETCEALIAQMPDKVFYMGDVQPANVQHILSQYHALILLTKGENFGHALYESLSVGRPVVTSNFTPWKNLEKTKAGWNVGISLPKECADLLNVLQKKNESEWTEYCEGAHHLSLNYYNGLDTQAKYKELFALHE